jgi:hypothetical protein
MKWFPISTWQRHCNNGTNLHQDMEDLSLADSSKFQKSPLQSQETMFVFFHPTKMFVSGGFHATSGDILLVDMMLITGL